MNNTVTIGGDRLGAGGKRKQSLHNFERSTFDQSYLWRSTVSAGTLVPFMNEILLPGDSAEINLDLDVLTSPTLGPLFGSAKCQLDVFQVPVRLYVGALNVNKLNVGNDMYDVHIPQIRLRSFFDATNPTKKQINPSSLPAYLGTMGVASNTTTGEVDRNTNMLPYLAYWDIVKNYYANLQEDRFFYIHNDLDTTATIYGSATGAGGVTYIEVNGTKYAVINGTTVTKNLTEIISTDTIFIQTDETESKQFNVNDLKLEAGGEEILLIEYYREHEFNVNASGQTNVKFYDPIVPLFQELADSGLDWELTTTSIPLGTEIAPTLKECALTEIDTLLEEVKSNYTGNLIYGGGSTNQIISDLTEIISTDTIFIQTDETESKQFNVNDLKLEAGGEEILLIEYYREHEFNVNASGQTNVKFYDPIVPLFQELADSGLDWELTTTSIPLGTEIAPTLKECALTEIDTLLEEVKSNYTGNLIYGGGSTNQIISDLLKQSSTTYSIQSKQEGLCVKTYQADLFNNWIQTDWIDGTGGITETTSVDTTGNSFSIDTLNLAQKTYEMLNRIAISGGTYKDWIGAVYSHEARLGVNSPMYLGSLIKELAFQEVVSNAPGTFEGQEQPTGQLAGRGKLTNKNKGGYIKVKPVSEPTILLGIFSITPRIDYSQGIDWKSDLATMGELHAPNLDGIGYEDLLTERFAWWNNDYTNASTRTTYSAGKVPAWSNYMTNVNKCFGNFAEEDEQMWMTFNRRYEQEDQNIGDLTTYIDPQKFNHIFADERLDAMNYWVQISNRFITRRKMSAKQIPNL